VCLRRQQRITGGYMGAHGARRLLARTVLDTEHCPRMRTRRGLAHVHASPRSAPLVICSPITPGRKALQTVVRYPLVALLGVLALVAAGCGASATAPPPGLSISGPGLPTRMPPGQPQYANVAQRVKLIGTPPGGKEAFHIHALLHVYVNGLLSPVPANIGIDRAKGVESSLHTHDATGIIHMEAPHPFSYT